MPTSPLRLRSGRVSSLTRDHFFEETSSDYRGGVTGLTACYELKKSGLAEPVLFEREDRVGGKIESVRESGLVVELGPDSIFLKTPGLEGFLEELGLGAETIEPTAQGFSIWLDGGLRKIPRGLSNPGKIDEIELASFPYLSEEAKRQVRNEHFVAPSLNEDESIRSFFSRRFGLEYAVRIAEPLYAGTHGGDPNDLSMEALYPQMRLLERRYGSLSRASKEAPGEQGVKFLSFKGGVQTLIDRLWEGMEGSLLTGMPVRSIKQDGTNFVVEGMTFDSVLLTTSASVAAGLTQNLNAKAADLLGKIAFASSTIVTFLLPRAGCEADFLGTGFLVPSKSELPISGATFSSHKWAGRSSREEILIRVFFRGVIEEPEDIALAGLRQAIGEIGTPVRSWVTHWRDGLPQYRLGHVELVESIQSELLRTGPLFVAGQSFRGAGIPDCIAQGRKVARDMLVADLVGQPQ